MLTESENSQIDTLFLKLQEGVQRFLGYPIATDFNYELLYRFLQFPLNNIGDPFQDSTYAIGTREFEREVVDFFADIYHAPKDDYWGYVTNGGTEGNLYGLYLARELHRNGIVYFSEDTHYSVNKNVNLLGMRYIMIKSQPSGEIDYDDLRESIRLHRDVPVIIMANIGTTMKEARDDISKIRGILTDLVIQQSYIHSDSAFCGTYAPFIEPKPAFDFADGADSVAVSGHKFVGSPIPCGVVIVKKRNAERIGEGVGYIGCRDTTITGSRNGFTPLVLWYAIKTLGKEGLKKRLNDCLEIAEYAVEAMNRHGIPAWRNPNALTVVLPKVKESIKNKWQLATSDVSHIIVAPGVTKAQIDTLIQDLVGDLNI